MPRPSNTTTLTLSRIGKLVCLFFFFLSSFPSPPQKDATRRCSQWPYPSECQEKQVRNRYAVVSKVRGCYSVPCVVLLALTETAQWKSAAKIIKNLNMMPTANGTTQAISTPRQRARQHIAPGESSVPCGGAITTFYNISRVTSLNFPHQQLAIHRP